jgi:hypothetical protein
VAVRRLSTTANPEIVGVGVELIGVPAKDLAYILHNLIQGVRRALDLPLGFFPERRINVHVVQNLVRNPAGKAPVCDFALG